MRCSHIDVKRGQCRRYGTHVLHVYKPIPLVGRKARRERSELDLARAAVKARSEGWCEAHELLASWDIEHANRLRRGVCGTIRLHEGTNAHHLYPSDRAFGVHDPARMVWLCDHAHPGWVHGNVARAEQLGLLRPEVA